MQNGNLFYRLRKKQKPRKPRRVGINGSEIQAVAFNNQIWTATAARAWLKRNKIKPIKRVDKTLNLLRYRIKNPNKYHHFSTQKTISGISFIIGYKVK